MRIKYIKHVITIGIMTAVLMLSGSTAYAESNPGSNVGQRNGTYNSVYFYAYVKKGEYVKYDFTLRIPAKTKIDASVTMSGTAGESHINNIPKDTPAGTVISHTGTVATTDGVWRVALKNPDNVTIGRHVYQWSMGVYDSSNNLIPGRIYVTEYTHDQSTNGNADVMLWYVDDIGYKYKATFRDYNGYNSWFKSGAVGVSAVNSCEPAYQSGLERWAANINFENEFVGSFNLSCKNAISRIFFAEPAADLPESAITWDNKTMNIAPNIKPTQIDNLQFEHDGNGSKLSGKAKFTIKNYASTVRLLVDTNNNGTFGDPDDREIMKNVQAEGEQEIDFDGLDGNSQPIPLNQTVRFQVVADRKGEIHFTNSDVEHRGGGIEIQRLNGSNADRSLIFFDDSKLGQNRCGVHSLPAASGPNGISSTGGVHSWTGIGIGCTGTIQAAGDWQNASWGDFRSIDDWTWDTGVVDKSMIYTYNPPAFPNQTPAAPNTGSLRFGRFTPWLVVLPAIGAAWTILRQRN